MGNNEKYVIISGGSIDDASACAFMKNEKYDVLLAADSGMEFLKRNHMIPDIIIGDFDSVGKDTLEFFENQPNITFQKLIPEKDDTDTEYAIRYAISCGAKSITLLGATGTRLDHVLANISLLGIGLEQNIDIKLVDAHNRIRMISKGIELKKEEQYGKYVSLIPYSKQVKNVTLKGMKYPLDKYTMEGYNSLGVSNEILDEKAVISFEDGVLLVIESKD